MKLIVKSKRKKKLLITDYNTNIMDEILSLTNDQTNALVALNIWNEDKDDLFRCLTGSAGTGKTTLTKKFIADNRLYSKSLCVAAPTHQAKEVISIITGIKTSKTVQELVGMKLNYDIVDVNISNINFITDINKIKIGNFEFIIVDEASMLNKALFDYLIRFATMYKTKILFLGDSFQAPPIKETISPVFKQIPQITLNEIIRQKATNPITSLIAAARKAVLMQDDSFINYCKQHIDNALLVYEGYNIINEPKLALERYVHYYEQLSTNTRFVHYMNDIVVAWNKAIRKELIDSDVDYTTADRIVGYNTISDKNGNFVIQNSMAYAVRDIKHNHTIVDGYKLNYYELTIVTDNGISSTIKVVKEESIEDFKKIAIRQIDNSLRQRSWKQYYNFKDTYLLNKKIELLLQDNNGNTQKQTIDKSLDYSYCITSHKVQGSTYDYVFINLKNLMRMPASKARERNSLIYVAVSRASKGVTILI